VITMMMVKLLQSFYVMSAGICVRIVTDSFTSIGEQKLIRDRWSIHDTVLYAQHFPNEYISKRQ